MITAGGILLGIAFLSSILTTRSVMASLAAHKVAGIESDAQSQARTYWLSTMALIVCTVGIANSMLMSVSERFKEIGTMKCLGALDSFVRRLFMIEAGVLGLIASSVGWAVGFVVMFLLYLVRYGWKETTQMGVTPVVQNFGACVVVGTLLTLLATVFPAQRASQLPPAAALRSEV